MYSAPIFFVKLIYVSPVTVTCYAAKLHRGLVAILQDLELIHRTEASNADMKRPWEHAYELSVYGKHNGSSGVRADMMGTAPDNGGFSRTVRKYH